MRWLSMSVRQDSGERPKTASPICVSLVELGKVLAQRIIPEIESAGDPPPGHDSSTNNLIQRYRRSKAAQTGGTQ